MAARVIHFGFDDCYRVKVLRSAGYEVKESHSLVDLRTDLQRDDGIAAVFVSSDDEGTAEEAATIARNSAPVIVFRREMQPLDESKFDCIFERTIPPADWLSATAEVIANSRGIREASEKLRIETKWLRDDAAEVCAESRRQIERARILIGRNDNKP